MRLDSFVIGFLVFTAVVLAGTFVLTDINTNYADQGVNLSTDNFGPVYNTTTQILSLSEDIKNDTFGGTIDETDTASSMFLGAYSALRAVRSTFTLFGEIAQAIGKELPIHPIFIQIAIAIMVILVVFAIIYLIFQVL